MKRIISNVMLVAAAATAFFSCQKPEVIEPETSEEVMLTFSSEKPAFDDETKTEWTGETIQWSKGDQIAIAYTVDGEWMGATNQSTGNLMGTKLYKSAALTKAAEIAQFNVNSSFNIVKEGEHVFYGVYPAPESTDFPNAPFASLEIPAVQTPTASSFDPSADLMTAISVGEFTSLPEEGEKISMMWTRLVAHANITLKDINGAIAGEKVLSVKLTAQEGANLVGKQKVNILTNEVENNNVTANVLELSGSALSVAEGGNVEFWACILPETLTSLTVVLDTDKATYTREITGISKTFKKNARNILAINMSSAKRDEKVVVPEDKTVTGTLTFDTASKRIVSTTSQQVWSENDITLTYNKAGYNNNLAEYVNPVRFYANTTISLEAPGNIEAIEFECNTNSYATALKNAISGSSVNGKIVSVTLDASSSFVTYEMTAQVRMDALTVTYVKSESGETPADPVLSVTTTEVNVGAAGGNGEIAYSVENAVDGMSVSAATSVDWITDFNYSIAGKVTFKVSANTGAERSADVTLTYPGAAESKKVTVKQAAAQGGGTKTISFKLDKTVTGSTSTNYVQTETAFTHDGIQYAVNNWNPSTLQIRGNQSSQSNMQSGKNFYLRNKTAIPGKITSIKVEYTSGSLVATSIYAVTSTSQITNQTTSASKKGTAATKAVIWDFDANGGYFAIGMQKGGTSGTAISGIITITYEEN